MCDSMMVSSDDPFELDSSRSALVSMGVFHPLNVGPAHPAMHEPSPPLPSPASSASSPTSFAVSDPASAGVPFQALHPRQVALHGQRFSPCNAQLALVDDGDSHLAEHACFVVAAYQHRY